MSDLSVNIASKLIQRESVTPDDGGCQPYIESLLAPLGFVRTSVDRDGITNSIYTRKGELPGTLAFAGHTDVVPTGPAEKWSFDPFSGEVVNGALQGRGAQDMKSAIACWIAAVANLCSEYTPIPTIQILITSDEEGDSIDGTIRMVERMQAEDSLPDACVVGEPSCSERIGDTIRRGRRGVVQIKATFHGRQGHSAYPQDADNAIHHAVPVLAKVTNINWGAATEGFPPTSCQVTNVRGGTGAMNVIAGTCEATIDIRYNPANNFNDIKAAIEAACEGCDVTLDFDHSATAFSTADGPFLDLICGSIKQVTAIEAVRDTGGGTSDGRFLAAAGVPVAEVGTTNSTIHQIDEQVNVSELEVLTAIYTDIIEKFEVE